jgi:hypothetical protein
MFFGRFEYNVGRHSTDSKYVNQTTRRGCGFLKNIILYFSIKLHWLTVLICVGTLEGATSCRARSLLVCYAVTFLYTILLHVSTLPDHQRVDTFTQLLHSIVSYSPLFQNLIKIVPNYC